MKRTGKTKPLRKAGPDRGRPRPLPAQAPPIGTIDPQRARDIRAPRKRAYVEVIPRAAAALLDWFRRHARDLPWRRTRDPYAIWVSEIMLQQTQVKTVIPYWERWMRALPTIQSLATAPPERVLKLWEGLGHYTRARNLRQAARVILEKHGGRFPETFEEMLSLPGIGRYTAGAIGSIAFNQPKPVLDGNVTRVLCRVFAIRKDPKQQAVKDYLWELAARLVEAAAAQPAKPPSADNCSHCNQALMELGAVICTPRNPDCPRCPLRNQCRARRAGLAGVLPVTARPMPTTTRHEVAFVIEHCGRVLVRQRPAGVVNALLWEFPVMELTPVTARSLAVADQPQRLAAIGRLARRHLKLRLVELRPLHAVSYCITRYRFRLEALQACLQGSPTARLTPYRRLRPTDLPSLAYTAAHRKILMAWVASRRERAIG